MKPNIGVLGLGIIGSRVVENLRKAGHDVFVWSRSARAVPNFLASPREVAEAAGIVQIFVRDSTALLDAINDMLPALKAGHLIMNHATVSKNATLEAAKLVEATGASFLDAPFTGSKMAAQNGKLCYYIGGDDLMLERAKPVLEASAAKILPLGGIGDAMVLKIVTNLVSAVIVEAVSEAAAITRASDIDLARLHTALESNANYSTLIGMKLPAIMNSDFEPHFSLRNMLKDADFARELAAEAKLPCPALDCTAAAMRAGVDAGKGDLDFSVIGQR
ncbi:MAG: NAD(P)-dependent oxidoreductase [Verrucomicrobiaceae bacterium]|nr:NAD(P)-dependent oxidoreductase [Verrucomicrobiaceae bacterium]